VPQTVEVLVKVEYEVEAQSYLADRSLRPDSEQRLHIGACLVDLAELH
jgi:hypothetical protein